MIKKANKWLKDAILDYLHMDASFPGMVYSPIGSLFVLMIMLELNSRDERFNQFQFNKSKYSYIFYSNSKEIGASKKLQEELNSVFSRDIEELKLVFKDKFTEREYETLYYLSHELKMSPYRFLLLNLRSKNLPEDGKLFKLLKDLKRKLAESLKDPFIYEIMQRASVSRATLKNRLDLSPELKKLLIEIEKAQNTFMHDFSREQLLKTLKEDKKRESKRSKEVLKDRKLALGKVKRK